MSLTASLEKAISDAPVIAKKSAYIANPIYDYVFFIYSPLWALWLGIMISGTPFADEDIALGGREAPLGSILIGAFIMAHIGIVFFRSHLNREVFKQHPLRFTLVPLALFIAMSSSSWVIVGVTVLATWWDVYHSSLQTFGLGRIYDMKQGNDARVGRQLDINLNLLLYAGPILAGATLMEHVNIFSEFEDVGSVFFTSIPATVESNRRYLTWAVTMIGVPFLMYYVFAYWRLHCQGYQVSFQKVALLVSTGLCSIFTWGFNTFGEAFFIMNFFHALQYFAIVWWTEKKNLVATLGLEKSRIGKPLALAMLVIVGVGYGFWAELSDSNNSAAYNLIMVIAIMHFWYDGFIWSVRKKQVG
jgi:hypothetical protein